MPKLSASSLIFNTAGSFAGSIIANVVTKGYKVFVSIINATRFRKALVMFIIIYNIAFLMVESKYFKELLLAYSAGVFEPFLIHVSNTVKRWILEELYSDIVGSFYFERWKEKNRNYN